MYVTRYVLLSLAPGKELRALATLTCTVLRACLPKIPLPISTTVNPIRFKLPTTVVPSQEVENDPMVTHSMDSVSQQALTSGKSEEEHERNLTVDEYDSIPFSAHERIENVDGNSESMSSMQNEEESVNFTDNSTRGHDVSMFDPFFPEMPTVVPPRSEACTQEVHVPPPELSGVVRDCQKYVPTTLMSKCCQQEDHISKEIEVISEDSEPSQRNIDAQSPTSHIVVPTGSLATEPTAEHSDDRISFTIEPAASADSCAYGSTVCHENESCKWTPQSVLANFEECHPQRLGHNPPCDPPSQYHKHPGVER